MEDIKDIWYTRYHENAVVLAEGVHYSLDGYETRLNNNLVICGTSGSGKTRGLFETNLAQAIGSYVVTDPKASLYDKWKSYLEEKGYEVYRIDFCNPGKSIHFNPFAHIQSEYDVMKVAHTLVYANGEGGSSVKDPYWDQMTELLLTCLISYLHESGEKSKMNFAEILRLAALAGRKGAGEINRSSEFADLIAMHKRQYGESLAVRTFQQVDTVPNKTFSTILSTLYSAIGKYTVAELAEMMKDNDLDFSEIGKKKTALFVVVSDNDRALDTLSNLCFSMIMNNLIKYADEQCEEQKLPVPVRFWLDDFATNVRLTDIPRQIASIRSRNISIAFAIQCESQLTAAYASDADTLIANCDTYVYLGTNEVKSMEAIAKRANVPVEDIMYLPVGESLIFRRGSRPVRSKNIDRDKFVEARRGRRF